MLAGGRATAGEWLGRTEEGIDDPARCGLSKPRVTTAYYPRTWRLDIDRDGDEDGVRIVQTEARTTVELELRAADGRLAPAWSKNIESAGAVTNVRAAHLTAERRFTLIVEFSRAPYLLAFPDATGTRAGPPEPVALDRRFPDRAAATGAAVEPYLQLAQVMDWDGDGVDDILVVARAVNVDSGGAERIRRHALFVLRGGTKLEERGQEAIDLARLGARANLCALADFDGDGVAEVLLETERARGGGVTAGELLCIRKLGTSLRQENAWPVTASNLILVLARDLNNDTIPDCVLADHASRQLILLVTRRHGERPFSFEPRQVALPAQTFTGAPANTAFFGADLDADGTMDFFMTATDHNQLTRILVGADGALVPSVVTLPDLPAGPPSPDENWHAKSVWFGDADGDGADELLVLSNEPLDPEFLPPRDPTARRDKLIQSIVAPGGERRHYAPYFRLLVYRVGAASIRRVCTLNTQLSAAGYDPCDILLGDFDADGRPELVLEALPRAGGRPTQSVFKFKGRLPADKLPPASGVPAK